MPKKTHKATDLAAPTLCRGCIYLERRYKIKTHTAYKCVLSDKATYPDRFACSMREEQE